MKTQFTQWKPSTLPSDRSALKLYLNLLTFQKRKSEDGFTLTELLVGLSIGFLVVSLALFGSLLNRQVFVNDKARSDITQALRLPLDAIGGDVRQAGEGLNNSDPNFPVILLETDPTELVIRRQLLPASMPVCQDIKAGSRDAIVILDQNGDETPLPGCEVVLASDINDDGWPDRWDNIRNYRLIEGGKVRAFIYDGNGKGEFFDYQNELLFDEDDNAVTNSDDLEYIALENGSEGTWKNNYNADSSSRIYLIEERRYQIDDENNILQLVINDDNENILNLTNDIGLLEVTAVIAQEGETFNCSIIPPTSSDDCSEELPNDYSWSQIRSIEITLQVDPESSAARTLQRRCEDPNNCEILQLSRSFVPRNIFNY
ncbi:hypothetical protein AWQ21_15405 (plasmid) [Picosynechococcus sp. PCC 7003]|uniref:PilW family protein n=1 Tax=Picosynechococcus sp. PCC 7003 TaxID=374981 RepID=UPI000810D3FF|nr:prepilin-type N-terminal cleavage/methylation domain-containing protein [Picosynechococcus sp. PCC 7003]ANV85913.1 hypothetical protein AWQ21_15405 [Picosynechococcus sp. PCC 7003]